MLKMTVIKLIVKDLESEIEDSIIDKVSINSKVDKIKSWINSQLIKLFKTKLFIKQSFELSFLTPRARLAFIILRQAFTKILIIYYIDLKYYILVKNNSLNDGIGEIKSQQIFDDLNLWHLMIFFSK